MKRIFEPLYAFGLAGILAAGAQAQTTLPPVSGETPPADKAVKATPTAIPTAIKANTKQAESAKSTPSAGTAVKTSAPVPIQVLEPLTAGTTGKLGHHAAAADCAGCKGEEKVSYGPMPIQKVHILQNFLREMCGKEPLTDAPAAPADACNGCAPKGPCLQIFGWMDFDYTYRSTGSGVNNIAPVMNRFGNEALCRSLGLAIIKPLTNELSWGFNMIYIGGADAAFLNPTQGWVTNPNPRFSQQFTDLNLTLHLPILTEGGIDIKAGRQTTILGPMGALPWQRPFDSSDYAWYNMEEGRYTGVSTVWHITKRLDWYNGVELGWGTFYSQIGHDFDYITNISYWLDEDAKRCKVWTTVLTGPTSLHSGANTTVFELGTQINYTDRLWQIVDTQMVWSKGPVNATVPNGYYERAYDVYTYMGYRLTPTLDLNGRLEWYYDQDGLGYAGGFGVPNTNYYEVTLGIDYHPTKWVQFRPEIRYDHASNPNFGPNNNQRNQLSLAFECLFRF